MQMNKKLTTRIILLMCFSALLLVEVAAQTESKAPVPVQDESETQAETQSSAEAAPDSSATDQSLKQTQSASGTQTPVIQKFTPTEQIDADSAVSFPIDI
jgi:hypothetical protein